MARVHYVECPLCRKEYYIDQILYEAILSNPKQKLKCPFCKKEFCLSLSKNTISPGQ
jgi:hypothetical protein